VVGWSLVGVGAVAAAGTGYFLFVGKQKSDKITDQSKSQPPQTFDPAVEENGKDANTRALLLGIGSGVAVAGGVLVLVLAGRSTMESSPAPVAQAAVSPWIGGGVVGAGASLHF
jgi:hypothetical protein